MQLAGRSADLLGAFFHIKQIALLARSTGRTLVLPRAAGGRYGLCQSQCVVEPPCAADFGSPFEAYHSLSHFEDVMGVRAVKYRDFVALSQQAADEDAPLNAINLDVRVRPSLLRRLSCVQEKLSRRDVSYTPGCMEGTPLAFGRGMAFTHSAHDNFAKSLTAMIKSRPLDSVDAVVLQCAFRASRF